MSENKKPRKIDWDVIVPVAFGVLVVVVSGAVVYEAHRKNQNQIAFQTAQQDNYRNFLDSVVSGLNNKDIPLTLTDISGT